MSSFTLFQRILLFKIHVIFLMTFPSIVHSMTTLAANVSLDVSTGTLFNETAAVAASAVSGVESLTALTPLVVDSESSVSNAKYQVSPLKPSSSSSSSSAQKSFYGGVHHHLPLEVLSLPSLPQPATSSLLPYPSPVKYIHPVYTRVKLGYGTFYYDGHQAELRCHFPYNLQVLSNFVWNKMSDNLYHYLDVYRVFERTYGHTTTLYISDVIAKDLGIYACAVTGSFYGDHPVTFYQEVHFFPPPGQGGGRGGGGAGVGAALPLSVGKRR